MGGIAELGLTGVEAGGQLSTSRQCLPGAAVYGPLWFVGRVDIILGLTVFPCNLQKQVFDFLIAIVIY